MDYHTKKDIEKAQNVLFQSNDPRFNYSFHKEEDIEQLLENQEFILTMDKFDYGVVRNEGDEMTLPEIIPYSLSSIKTLEEGEMWYQQKYPNLPDIYHGIMARYSFGELLTKKEIKNTIKKCKKKGKDLPVGMVFKEGNFKLDFS